MTSFTSLRARAHRARLRRTQRGAAFVESLIVISLIMFVLFAVLWLQAVYAAKLQTMQMARANAWSGALDGCPGLEQASSMLDDAVSQSNSGGANPPGDSNEGTVGGLTASTQGEDSPGWFNLREGGQASESVDFQGFVGGAAMPISTLRKFPCNERSNPKELTLSAGDLFSNVSSIIRDLFN